MKKNGEFADCVFRFRSLDSLFKYKELENAEIYFCPFDGEDDILEGNLNLYWQADEILWDNFFAHYFLVFMNYYIKLSVSLPEEQESPEKIDWYIDRTKYRLEQPIEDFLNLDVLKAVKKSAMWNNHRVEADELLMYLNLIHPFAFNIAVKVITEKEELKHVNSSDLAEMIEHLNDTDEVSFKINSRLIRQFFDATKRKIMTKNLPDWYRWLCIDFPNVYFETLKTVPFSKWYLASFCNDCTDPRQWKDYADNHEGVCLVFKTYPLKSVKYDRGIRLRTCREYNSSKGQIYRYHTEPLRDVKYVDTFPAVNFFEVLGTPPGGLLDSWLHDRKGNKSSYYSRYYDNRKKDWLEFYWEKFESLVTHKSSSWNNQAEKRVVLQDMFFEAYSSKESRKIKYQFEDLQGIIWEVSTSDDNKKKIRDIIDEKCRKENRSDFKYYQLEINPEIREFVVEPEVRFG